MAGLTHPCKVGGWTVPGRLHTWLLPWGAACSGRCGGLGSSSAVPRCPLLLEWEGGIAEGGPWPLWPQTAARTGRKQRS